MVASLALALWTGSASATDEARRLSANGAEFAYVEAGQGEPLILIHGGLQDYRFWRDLLPAFADRFRVVAYSRRNRFPFPLSAEGAPDGAGDLHADDLAAIVRALGLERVHVVGHSSGAVTALFFAANNPGLVRSLVLNEPPAGGLLAGTPDGGAILREQGARLAPAREAFAAGDLERGVRLFTDAVRGPGAFDRGSDADKRMAFDNALSHVADQVSTRPRAAFGCEQAGRIGTPALLTGGERSTPFFGRILDALERCMPRVERAVIPAAAHNVPGDNPAAFRETVVAFLGRQQ
jgi:pimeloyl-ACP methyl ester carboxylesterase